MQQQEASPRHKSSPELRLVERLAHAQRVVVQQPAVQHQLHVTLAQRGAALAGSKVLHVVQCGHRYYASAFFRDFQNVFHDIIPGVVWKVSTIISCSCNKYEEFLIKTTRLKSKKRGSQKKWVAKGIMQVRVSTE